MLPAQLNASQFDRYRPEARRAAIANVGLLQRLPLVFLPLLLRELIAYDAKFPAERKELDRQLVFLTSLTPEQLRQWMAPFAGLQLSPELERVDWVNTPAQFSEQLAAHLWATHQIDAFRAAAVEYVKKLNAAVAAETVPVPRLTIVVIGQGVAQTRSPLFQKLRPQGVHYTRLNPANGNRILLDAVAARAAAHPVPFGHWYVEGGTRENAPANGVTCVSYRALEPLRAALLKTMEDAMQSGLGAEALRSRLAQMGPQDLGMQGSGDDAVLNEFQISLLTEGSGTQIFSTTFVQWSAREILRRAQPLTLLARFAPRWHERSLKEQLAGAREAPALDAEGALVDADMGAYYTWINQQRLPRADEASFLVWFENHSEALAIGPSQGAGKESEEELNFSQLLGRLA